MTTTIYEYPLQQAIADGVLAEVFQNRWDELTGGKTLVATSHILAALSLAAVQEIWNEFVAWREHNPGSEAVFATTMNGRKVWVLEDEQAFTVLYPEEY
jgi:hypothetical protein